jgi:hypothetical protein
MSTPLPYPPIPASTPEPEKPSAPELPKHFARMLIGMALIAIGAILINHGMNAVQEEQALIVGVGMMAAGALFVFAGASRVWPGKTLVNFALLVAGIALLMISGSQLAADWGRAVYGIFLTTVGIAMIVVGVQVAKRGWEKYTSR